MKPTKEKFSFIFSATKQNAYIQKRISINTKRLRIDQTSTSKANSEIRVSTRNDYKNFASQNFPPFSQQPSKTWEQTYLRDEHDTDGGAGHDIDLEILAPFVGPNPAGARQEELEPVDPGHALDLGSPSREQSPREAGGWRRRRRCRGGVLQGDNLDRSRRRCRHDVGRMFARRSGKVSVAWRGVGYLHAHHLCIESYTSPPRNRREKKTIGDQITTMTFAALCFRQH